MKNLTKPCISLILALFVVLGIFIATPASAKAFDFFPDPRDLFDFGGGHGFPLPLPFPDPVGFPLPLPFPSFPGSYPNNPPPAPAPAPQPPINNTNTNTNTIYVNSPSHPGYDYPDYPSYPPSYDYPHYPPYYPPYQPVYPISVSCFATPTQINTGGRVSWSAYASGGTGSFTYTWSGTDSLSGRGQYIDKRYNSPGLKYAWVTARSGDQTITQYCSTTVNVIANYPIPYPTPAPYPVPYPNPYPPYRTDLDIACFADPNTARVNQPVNWTAEVAGGVAPYAYSWSGTDNLTGISNNVIKYYSTTGTKSAVVTVRSADGRTGTRACSNTVSVTSGTVAKKPAPKPTQTPVCCIPPQYYQPGQYQQPQYGEKGYQPQSQPQLQYPPQQYQNQPQQQQSGQPQVIYVLPDGRQVVGDPNMPINPNPQTGSIFSLRNVPWGLVTTLVILVLFFTVIYLIFNRTKI